MKTPHSRTIYLALVFALIFGKSAYGDTVAKVIAAEACGEGKEGMYAVANVIANRSKEWKKTPLQVVMQKNQFYGYTASNRERLYSECKNTADELARNIMDLEDITQGALYFRQPTEPIYSWHGEKTVIIKGHIFHKERRK